MRAAEKVGGMIRDDTGQPLQGAQVFVHFPQRLLGPHTPDIPSVSDAAGRWQNEAVPADAEYIRIAVVHPDYVWDGPQPSKEQLRKGDAVIPLTALHALTGVVLDPDGQPVAGARVFRGEEWGIMALEPANEVTTDSQGRFRFPPAKGGKAQVAAWAASFGPVIQLVDETAKAQPVELRLTQPHTLKLRVTDLEGHPLAGAEASIAEWNNLRDPPGSYKADAEGRLTLTNGPAGQMFMDFSFPGCMENDHCQVEASSTEQVVRLAPALRLHGNVVDAKTGEPIKSFKLFAGWPRQVLRNGSLTNEGAQWDSYNPRSFQKGVFDWSFTRPPIMGTREPPDILLKAEADGYGPAISRLFKATERDAEFQFRLEPPVYLPGTVRFKDGKPAAGAQIFAAANIWDVQTHNGRVLGRRSGQAEVPVKTDEEGHFKLPAPTEPQQLLVWHEAGFAELDDATLRRSPEITLSRWGHVEGTLKRGTQVAAHEPVGLCFPSQWEQSGQHVRMRQHFFLNYQANTDDTGHFVFDCVPPGEVAVTRIEPVNRPQNFGLPLGDIWGGCRLTVARLSENQELKLDVGGNGRAVVGRFSATNGVAQWLLSVVAKLPPVPYPPGLETEAKQKWVSDWFWSDAGARYRIWLGGTPQVMESRQPREEMKPWAVAPRGDGTFRIDDLPPGSYTISATMVDSQARFQPLPGPRITHEFVVPEGANLAALPSLDIGAFGNVAVAETELEVPEPSRTEPVTARMQPNRQTLRAGDAFELLVRVRIVGGSHIYPLNEAEKPFVPTTLKLPLPSGVEAAGDWLAPEPSLAKGGEKIYADSVVFRRPMKVRGDAAVGALSFDGELQYQVCTAEVCWPPKTISLSAAMTIQKQTVNQ
jgi:protocatechuate 3,4-dioxygenase beta subunit